MTILRHELRQGRTSLLIWTAAIASLMAICILIYPEMGEDLTDMGDMFANMGAFSAAFGMDKLSFGTLTGFFSIECGNVLGLGGGLFAAMTGVSALCGEEQGHTAEFLLIHPVSRTRVVGEKLGAVLLQVTLLNVVVVAVTALSVAVIGEEADWKVLWLLFLAYYLLQVEMAAVTFGLSAFLRRGGLGIGLGAALGLYFLNLISNMTKSAEPLKYLTPFSYTDGAYVAEHGSLQIEYLAVGAVLSALGVALAFWQYRRKDIS